MQHRIISGQHFFLSLAEIGQGLLKLLISNIGFVVQQGPIIDNQNLVIGDHLRRLQGQLFLVQLVFNDEILELLHAYAVGKRPDTEAGDQVRGGLRDGDHLPAVLRLKFFQNPADQCGFPGGGAACKHNFCNGF